MDGLTIVDGFFDRKCWLRLTRQALPGGSDVYPLAGSAPQDW